MTEKLFMDFIRDVGFPAGIAIIMLYFFLKSWNAYQKQVEMLNSIIHEQNGKIIEQNGRMIDQNEKIVELLDRQREIINAIERVLDGPRIIRLLEENQAILRRILRHHEGDVK